MTTFAILATGPSMSQAVADAVRAAGVHAVAVSDAFRLAPWADALVSQDRAWWAHHQDALQFDGMKFAGQEVAGVNRVEPGGIITTGTNSGLLACHVAVTVFGATRLLLLGLDMKGSHYFGAHPQPLKNTTDARYAVMREQFRRWSHKGVEVFNCTPGSALTCFPSATLREALCVLG